MTVVRSDTRGYYNQNLPFQLSATCFPKVKGILKLFLISDGRSPNKVIATKTREHSREDKININLH